MAISTVGMSLLEVIDRYDRNREAYIVELEEENRELKRQLADAIDRAVSQALTSDRMKLELIMSGALIKPKEI